MDDADAALAAEFDCLAARAGLAIPPDRRAAIFASFLELRRQAALLRAFASRTTEPAHTLDLRAVLRAART